MTRRRRALPLLFVAAAGPRIGFGHLVRCRSLARAMGVPPVAVVRGTAATRARARADGWQLVTARTDDEVLAIAPRLIVVDDPSAGPVRAWVSRARRLGVPVATVHDLGIAATASDLLVDASLAPAGAVQGRQGTLHGPAYAILDPALAALRERVRESPSPAAAARKPRVIVALGGGRTTSFAARIAAAIAARVEAADVRVARGFAPGRRLPLLPRGRWIEARDGLARELASASVAVVAGGVTLYEACALGVAAVAVPLNAAQGITVREVAGRGAAVRGGSTAREVARQVERLLRDPAARRRLSRAGRRLVDGRGAMRVAARLRRLPAAPADKMSDVA